MNKLFKHFNITKQQKAITTHCECYIKLLIFIDTYRNLQKVLMGNTTVLRIEKIS